METKIENTIPVLPVKNLKESIRFYTETLGFKVDFATERVGSVSRDGCSIMLDSLRPDAGAAWVWIGVRDFTLFEQYRQRGVEVHQEPQNHPWAYEMKFKDIDGNVLWLGTETRSGLPVES